ncbi:MAG: class I SAM-dependent methyltransferase [Candidatus Nanopelagicales bacterium]
MSETGLAAHWDDAYAQGETTRSWFESDPAESLRMIDAAGATADASVVDVGGGTSRLVDSLLARGHRDLTVVDISEAALHITQERLGRDASRVVWIHTDINSWSPDREFDIWHDRAVLHFLTAESDQRHYRQILNASSRPGTIAIFGCFAPDGPTHCSGLPVVRRDPSDLAEFLGADWSLVAQDRESHATPAGAVQPFTWAAFVRVEFP